MNNKIVVTIIAIVLIITGIAHKVIIERPQKKKEKQAKELYEGDN
jgi:hypothetical protein